jgi:uncharacterized protein YdeI (YjbR/CyaY-like superfamily)
MSNQEEIKFNVTIKEIFGALKCKKCKQAVRSLIVAKTKEQRDKQLETSVDNMLGGETT